MPTISIQKPTDQPTGVSRFIDELRANLQDPDFAEFYMLIAYAKVGPLLRLEVDINQWIRAGKKIKAVFGIDQQVTSKQALDFALSHFSETHIAHVSSGPFNPTFHPKIYLFTGSSRAVAYIGSNNLTVGGTETNFESHIKMGLDLPIDNSIKNDVLSCWTDSLSASLPLTPALLVELLASDQVADETEARRAIRRRAASLPKNGDAVSIQFPKIKIVPPSPIPAGILKARKLAAQAGGKAQVSIPVSSGAQALVIQVTPHHNGEVFLSKRAVDQDPAFFGWPFTGSTVPKKAGNDAYPQRVPDPIVNVQVFDDQGRLVVQHSLLKLNTVYYSTKSDIRVTFPPDVISNSPEFSIMVIRQSADPQTYDYDIFIFAPGSSQYSVYLDVCNQDMPTGGKSKARKFGWL